MLANINLLPQKERKRLSMLLVWLIPLLVFLIGFAWMGKQFYDTKKAIGQNQQELATIEKQIQIEQNKVKGSAGTNSAIELAKLDQWLQENRLSTVKVLKMLTSYLPERGYFLSYQASQGGNINIRVQFDSLNEVSAYLYHLKGSPLVQDAVLGNVSTQMISKNQPSASIANLPNTPSAILQDVVPRYIAQFQIKINVQESRKEQKK